LTFSNRPESNSSCYSGICDR